MSGAPARKHERRSVFHGDVRGRPIAGVSAVERRPRGERHGSSFHRGRTAVGVASGQGDRAGAELRQSVVPASRPGAADEIVGQSQVAVGVDDVETECRTGLQSVAVHRGQVAGQQGNIGRGELPRAAARKQEHGAVGDRDVRRGPVVAVSAVERVAGGKRKSPLLDLCAAAVVVAGRERQSRRAGFAQRTRAGHVAGVSPVGRLGECHRGIVRDVLPQRIRVSDQPSIGNEDAAGVGVGRCQIERARTALDEDAAAGDGIRIRSLAGLVEIQRRVVRDRSAERSGIADQRALGDHRASGVGVGTFQRDRARTVLDQAVCAGHDRLDARPDIRVGNEQVENIRASGQGNGSVCDDVSVGGESQTRDCAHRAAHFHRAIRAGEERGPHGCLVRSALNSRGGGPVRIGRRPDTAAAARGVRCPVIVARCCGEKLDLAEGRQILPAALSVGQSDLPILRRHRVAEGVVRVSLRVPGSDALQRNERRPIGALLITHRIVRAGVSRPSTRIKPHHSDFHRLRESDRDSRFDRRAEVAVAGETVVGVAPNSRRRVVGVGLVESVAQIIEVTVVPVGAVHRDHGAGHASAGDQPSRFRIAICCEIQAPRRIEKRVIADDLGLGDLCGNQAAENKRATCRNRRDCAATPMMGRQTHGGRREP